MRFDFFHSIASANGARLRSWRPVELREALWALLATAIVIPALVIVAADGRAVEAAEASGTLAESAAEPSTLSDESLRFFEAKIRPVLVSKCYGCHSQRGGNIRGGLRLDTANHIAIGGTSGPAIVPGQPDESPLYQAMIGDLDTMPPSGMLPDAILRDFRRWIEMGAPDPRIEVIESIASTVDVEDIEQAKRTHWSLQPVVTDPDVPWASAADRDTARRWSRTDVDAFVAAELLRHELPLPEDAAAEPWLRRVCFDLTGLPPTKTQVQWFVDAFKVDPERAVDRVVDGLLGDDAFGEHFGRHWLDLARYAESTGSSVNVTYPHAWRYRDWVIDAFNDDMAYDHFVRCQLAGDLMPAADDDQWERQLIATTFLALGPKMVNEANAAQFEADLIDEQIDVATRVILGHSVACARCHDHKFDAIRQTDYYALAGVFGSSKTYYGNPPSEFGATRAPQNRHRGTLIRLPGDAIDEAASSRSAEEIESLRRRAEGLQQQLRQVGGRSSGGTAIQQRLRLSLQLSDIGDKLAVLNEDGDPVRFTMGVLDADSPADRPLLVRGEVDQRSGKVSRGCPELFCDRPLDIAAKRSGRLEVANSWTDASNPLFARVYVNRVWAWLFDRGLVSTPSDFGVTGARPSHPELLDHLTTKFVQSGWSTKNLVHEIVTSRVYRAAATMDVRSHEIDSENQWLWRHSPHRLEAESVRDAMLIAAQSMDEPPTGSVVAAAGFTRVRGRLLGNPQDRARQVAEETLRETIDRRDPADRREAFRRLVMSRRGGGPPRGSGDAMARTSPGNEFRGALFAKLNAELDATDANYRSVYLPAIRDVPPRSMAVFNAADTNLTTDIREVSHSSDQALFMMNNELVERLSRETADRILRTTRQPAAQVTEAFWRTLSRPPSTEERLASVRFVTSIREEADRANRDPLMLLCQSLFATAEFRVIE